MSHIDPVWVNLVIMRQKRWERERSDSKSCAEETERGGGQEKERRELLSVGVVQTCWQRSHCQLVDCWNRNL